VPQAAALGMAHAHRFLVAIRSVSVTSCLAQNNYWL
jgi:hypothetical protein